MVPTWSYLGPDDGLRGRIHGVYALSEGSIWFASLGRRGQVGAGFYRLKETCPTVNVIYASGYAVEATRATPPGEAHPDILSKPFALDDLAVQVQAAIGPYPLDGTSAPG